MGRDAAWGRRFPEAQGRWCTCFVGKGNQGTLALVIRESLAPVYINMFTMRKEKKKKPKRDKLFISINIKENCKTQSGVTQLLLRNHLVIASGKILLFLISVQWNCWGWTAQGTHVCLPLRALSSLPTGLSYPRGELCKDTPLGNRKKSWTSLELKM